MKSKSAYRWMSLVFVLLLIFIAFTALVINYFMYNPAEADTTLNLGVGETYEYPNDGYRVRYYSYDKSIAEIDKNGIITANSKGTTEIAAGRKRISVHVFDAPKSIDIKEKSFSLGVGEKYTLSPYIPNSDLDTGFKYSLSGDEAITIDKNGKIKAVKPGKTKVTISTYNDKTVSCEIRVGNAPDKISLSANSKTLYLGATGKIYINISADCASKETTVESSNEKIIKINSKGELKPVAVGSATIKATTYN
ncbi:MAG: Ig-like domain-containing protein, partial [Eubacterium sp.]|nr:Ig-like domain-containing protein [Eubacterium sp.]